MKKKHHIFAAIIFLIFSFCGFSQVNSLELNKENEKLYTPYMWARHGGAEGLADFKKNNSHQYLKELWYYSKSFYVKRNYLLEGVVLDESIIDISRFESSRKESEEALVILPGFRDALVLLPLNKLIYKP
ncbi:MAG: hypothetical protein PSX36_05730 [bacterium]|nr:hypothetical protein [bacterium]